MGDNINPDIDDLEWSDEDVEEEPEKEEPEPKLKKLPNRDKKLLDKYKDLQVDDEADVENLARMMTDRKALSERLEEDPKFREEYIRKEEERRAKIDADNADDIINRLQKGEYKSRTSNNEAEDAIDSMDDAMRELEDLDDIVEEDRSHINKPGVVINKVKNLVINININ
jgi:hypothetical protein